MRIDQDRSSFRYLFGPVPSRRFGRSLGIDLVPFKTCTLDCAFCEVGPTTASLAERREYAPVAAILDEFRRWVDAGGAADVVTLAGSGEPTLHARLGDIIRGIRALSALRIAILTNSTLLHVPDVRRDAALADIVKASLCAWDEASFARLHHPCAGIGFRGLIDGLTAFRAAFRGELWLEAMLVAGYNDDPDQVARIAALANALGAERVQLNTVVRPPAHAGAAPVPAERLASFCDLFRPRAEVIAPFDAASGAAPLSDDAIVAMLARRPCTVADIAAVTAMPYAEAARRIAEFIAAGRITRIDRDGQSYFQAANP